MQGKKPYTEKLFNHFMLSERVPKENFYRQLKEQISFHFLYSSTKNIMGKKDKRVLTQ